MTEIDQCKGFSLMVTKSLHTTSKVGLLHIDGRMQAKKSLSCHLRRCEFPSAPSSSKSVNWEHGATTINRSCSTWKLPLDTGFELSADEEAIVVSIGSYSMILMKLLMVQKHVPMVEFCENVYVLFSSLVLHVWINPRTSEHHFCQNGRNPRTYERFYV